MLKKGILGFGFLFLSLFFVQCKREAQKPQPISQDTLPSKKNTCSPDSVYFSRDVLPIFVSHCGMSTCHDPASKKNGVILTSYQNVMNWGVLKGDATGSFLFQIIEGQGKRMPPVPRAILEPAEKSLIQKWINQGAKNLSCIPFCDSTLAVSYSNHIVPILSKSCLGCHGNILPQGGTKLTDYENVKTYASNGLLLGVIQKKSGFAPMPPWGNLESCEIKLIEKWINSGAQKN